MKNQTQGQIDRLMRAIPFCTTRDDADQLQEEIMKLEENLQTTEIRDVEFYNVNIVIKGTQDMGLVDLGALTLSCEGREYMLDVVQSYSHAIENGLEIECELLPDADTFDDCPYNLIKEDLLNHRTNGLVKTLYVGGEIDFEVESMILDLNIQGKDYQLQIEEEL